jgi:putative hydrolase
VSDDHDWLAVDMAVDAHVHTGFSSGRATVGELVIAAESAGLTGLTFADAVDEDVPWLRTYVDTIRRARGRTDVALRAAVTVPVVRLDGWVALPADIGGLEALCLVVTGVPTPQELAEPARARDLLRWRAVRPRDVVEMVVGATIRGMERTSRYAPIQLARPLGVLAEIGVREADIDDAALRWLAAGCRATQAVVEVSEAWRTPSDRLAAALAEAGVPMVAASEAHEAAQVGQWRYASALADELAGRVEPTGRAEPTAVPAGAEPATVALD